MGHRRKNRSPRQRSYLPLNLHPKSKTKKKATTNKEKKLLKILINEKDHSEINGVLSKMNLVTPSQLSDRAKISITLAKKIMKEKVEEGALKLVKVVGNLMICQAIRTEKKKK